MPRPIQVGDPAPDFTLSDQNGDPITLSHFRGRPVVLYFYPKDDTPGCTAEACTFRDHYADFQELGAVIIGISGDSVAEHRDFANRYQLPFTLVSDSGNRVRQAYGVPATLWILPGRVTYVIDAAGIVRHIFDSQLNFAGHYQEALTILKQPQSP